MGADKLIDTRVREILVTSTGPEINRAYVPHCEIAALAQEVLDLRTAVALLNPPRPAWCAKPAEISSLVDWMLEISDDWDDLDAQEKIDKICSLLDKPWNYDNEYKLMTDSAYRCIDCGEYNEAESAARCEALADGDELRCGDCEDDRRGEAMWR